MKRRTDPANCSCAVCERLRQRYGDRATAEDVGRTLEEPWALLERIAQSVVRFDWQTPERPVVVIEQSAYDALVQAIARRNGAIQPCDSMLEAKRIIRERKVT